MLNLKNVTLFLADGRSDELSYRQSAFAIEQCTSKADFAKIEFLSGYQHGDGRFGYRKMDPFDIHEYSYLLSKKLHQYVDTDYALVIQHDGFILNTQNWDDRFWNYDYIGAPWSVDSTQRPECRVGNGGFSLRSRKLIDACNVVYNGRKVADAVEPSVKRISHHQSEPEAHVCGNEDWHICLIDKPIFLKHGIKFAPLEIAAKFSMEAHLPDCDNEIRNKFGFHGARHFDALKSIYGLVLS
jgi:hypothetical protein